MSSSSPPETNPACDLAEASGPFTPQAPSPADHELAWLAPAHRAAPTDALRRIRTICELNADLFAALMTVLATHQGLRQDILASALKNFRRDLEPYSAEDVAGLLRACWNGGWQGFDAVLRTRRSRDGRGAGALSWVKPDD